MKHPAYPLRANKAVDRFTLVEVIRRLESLFEMTEYTYYSLGGPYLEDFRLLYEFCPGIRMVSIEEDEHTYRRQRFHLPCGSIKLVRADLKSFLARYEARDRKSIFWLDYTGLSYRAFQDFDVLLQAVADDSVIKVTLRAEPSDYLDADQKRDELKRKRFTAEFEQVLPEPASEPPNDFEAFAVLLQEMLQIAAQRALPSGIGREFQPLCSFCYADGAGMFTLTGIVVPHEQRDSIRRTFRRWQFHNLYWRKPKRIDVPFLSTKERMKLQEFLPCERRAGTMLHRALGYIVDENRQKSAAKLIQYAAFHRYYPYFVRAIP